MQSEITTVLRKQHQDLLVIIEQLQKQLCSEDEVRQRPARLLTTLGQLEKRLSEHLHAEDKVLYPVLRKSGNKLVRKMAEEFVSELGGLQTFFESYLHRWFRSLAIIARPDVFIEETHLLILALKKRIDREDNRLFLFLEGEQPK